MRNGKRETWSSRPPSEKALVSFHLYEAFSPGGRFGDLTSLLQIEGCRSCRGSGKWTLSKEGLGLPSRWDAREKIHPKPAQVS